MTNKLSHQPKDSTNPNVMLAKAQAKADHWKTEAYKARAVVFDLIYPDYKTKEEEFKQQYIFYKEEMKKAIGQRDDLKSRLNKAKLENARLRSLMFTELEKEKEINEETKATGHNNVG